MTQTVSQQLRRDILAQYGWLHENEVQIVGDGYPGVSAGTPAVLLKIGKRQGGVTEFVAACALIEQWVG